MEIPLGLHDQESSPAAIPHVVKVPIKYVSFAKGPLTTWPRDLSHIHYMLVAIYIAKNKATSITIITSFDQTV